MRPHMAVAPAPRYDTAALGRVFRQILRNGAITGAVGSAVAIGGCFGGGGQSGDQSDLDMTEEEGSGGMSGTGGISGTGGMSGAGGSKQIVVGSGGDDDGAGTGGELTGSGGDDTGTGGLIGPPGMIGTPRCLDGALQYVSGLNPVSMPDYTGLHTFSDPNQGGDTYVVDSIGAICSGASNDSVCLASAMTPDGDVVFDECGQIGCSASIVVTTTDDSVEQHATMADLLAFLGSIDTPQEALLVARYDGYFARCDGSTTVQEVTGGFEIVVDNTNSCDGHYYRWTLLVAHDGSITVLNEEDLGPSMVVCGRRPAGLSSDGVADSGSAAADYFAACVHLEGAAVHAFDSMTLELLHHGAPRSLVAAARRSAAEERRHTELAAMLCEQADAPSPAVRLDDVVVRDLAAMARENVVEGCVRETYGALLANYQAQHARDPRVAETMAIIAEDETRHAALAWELSAWLTPQLSPEVIAELDTLRTRAVAELGREMARPMPDELLRDAGLPTPAEAKRMIDQLRDQLWS